MTFSLRPRSPSTAPLMGRLGEDTRGLLEGGGGDEGVGRERCLGDAEEQRASDCRTASIGDHAVILFAETELVCLLLQQEVRVSHFFYLHPAEHLPNDGLDVLIRDCHALQTIDFLDFVHQVSLQRLLAEYGKNIVRVQRTIHERLTGMQAFTLLHVDVDTARE